MADDNQIYPPAQPWTPPPKEGGQGRPISFWVALLTSLTTVVLGVLLWMEKHPGGAAQAAAPAAGPASPAPRPGNVAVPMALQPYLDAAQKGDTHAMRMLGAMYYHGLDLPRNRDEGLKWYRKAAESGSKVAKEELKQLE